MYWLCSAEVHIIRRNMMCCYGALILYKTSVDIYEYIYICLYIYYVYIEHTFQNICFSVYVFQNICRINIYVEYRLIYVEYRKINRFYSRPLKNIEDKNMWVFFGAKVLSENRNFKESCTQRMRVKIVLKVKNWRIIWRLDH